MTSPARARRDGIGTSGHGWFFPAVQVTGGGRGHEIFDAPLGANPPGDGCRRRAGKSRRNPPLTLADSVDKGRKQVHGAIGQIVRTMSAGCCAAQPGSTVGDTQSSGRSHSSRDSIPKHAGERTTALEIGPRSGVRSSVGLQYTLSPSAGEWTKQAIKVHADRQARSPVLPISGSAALGSVRSPSVLCATGRGCFAPMAFHNDSCARRVHGRPST